MVMLFPEGTNEEIVEGAFYDVEVLGDVIELAREHSTEPQAVKRHSVTPVDLYKGSIGILDNFSVAMGEVVDSRDVKIGRVEGQTAVGLGSLIPAEASFALWSDICVIGVANHGDAKSQLLLKLFPVFFVKEGEELCNDCVLVYKAVAARGGYLINVGVVMKVIIKVGVQKRAVFRSVFFADRQLLSVLGDRELIIGMICADDSQERTVFC